MWEGFLDLLFQALNLLHTPIGDWGMAIIVATIIFRLVLSPCSFSQTKSSFVMQKLTPKMNAIKEKYQDDPTRMQEETQKLYADAKYNPIIGCLPLLLQMPIFIALFQVLRSMSDRIGDQQYCFYNLVPNLVTSPSEAFSQGFLAFIPYLILIIVFAFATFLPMVLQQITSNADPSQRKQTLLMSGVMSVMMLFIGWGTPAGVLLFWGTSSIIAIIIQQAYLAYLKHQDAKVVEEEEAQPVQVEVVRKPKKNRPKKKR